MVRLFLDTNIWVIFLTGRDEQRFKDVSKLIKMAQFGELIPYSSSFVMMELYYVMTSVYKTSKAEAIDDINKLRQLRNLVTVDKSNTDLAFDYYKKNKIKLSDCFIATQVPRGVKMCTFDRDFEKIPDLEIVRPNEIIATLE